MNSLFQLIPGVTFRCYDETFRTVGEVTPAGTEVQSYKTGKKYLIPWSIAVDTRVTVLPYEEMVEEKVAV